MRRPTVIMKNVSPIPLYYQMETLFRSKITSGEWPVGYKLPPEKDISKSYGLSVVTIKQSLAKLVADGLITRKRGKGTYVEKSLNEERYQPLEGSLNQAITSEVNSTSVKVFDYQFIRPHSKIAKTLELKENQNVLYFKRLHYYYNSQEPFSLTVNYIPEEIGRKINPTDIALYSIIYILKEKCSVNIGYAKQIIRAIIADNILAEKLSVNMGFPILKLERTVYSVNEEPVEYLDIFYRGDKYIFLAELTYNPKEHDQNII